MKKYLFIILLIVLCIPTFWLMLRPGIYTMHDFHVFRQFEFDKCIADLQLPCRWAPDAGFEYGEPVFNFYAQLPYLFGEVFRVLGISVLDTVKILFALSLVLSGVAMYFFSKHIWKNDLSALVSSLVYVYAPYRAVDVWVRGALPEALAFLYFPLILLFLTRFMEEKKSKDLLWFGLAISGLIITHNLSTLMFLPVLISWFLYLLIKNRAYKLLPKLVLMGVLIIGLVSFYILPVILETKLVSLAQTTSGYYDFTNHYVTLHQLLLSLFWGYGGSIWGENDGLSFAVGIVQWFLPLFTLLLVIIFRKRIPKDRIIQFLIFLCLGWSLLFLTHNKSTALWQNLPGLAFVQFPWRFLGLAVFCFSLASGLLFTKLPRRIGPLFAGVVFVCLLALNQPFFKEDIWQKADDAEFFSGDNYQMQIASAVDDFWPQYGERSPRHQASRKIEFKEGTGSGEIIKKRSNRSEIALQVQSNQAEVAVPMVYFPGWQGQVDGQSVDLYPSGEFGLITTKVSSSSQSLALTFHNTAVRTWGNLISLLSVLISIILLLVTLRRTRNLGQKS